MELSRFRQQVIQKISAVKVTCNIYPSLIHIQRSLRLAASDFNGRVNTSFLEEAMASPRVFIWVTSKQDIVTITFQKLGQTYIRGWERGKYQTATPTLCELWHAMFKQGSYRSAEGPYTLPPKIKMIEGQLNNPPGGELDIFKDLPVRAFPEHPKQEQGQGVHVGTRELATAASGVSSQCLRGRTQSHQGEKPPILPPCPLANSITHQQKLCIKQIIDFDPPTVLFEERINMENIQITNCIF